jgi:hypothetical protein
MDRHATSAALCMAVGALALMLLYNTPTVFLTGMAPAIPPWL